MEIKSFLFVCIIFSLGINIKSQSYCDFINEVKTYQDSVELIETFEDECRTPEIDTTSFDINVYLSLFDKLRLDSGKICRYINSYSNRAGKPMLYVKDVNFNEDQYIKGKIATERSRIDSVISQKKDSLPEDELDRVVHLYENLKDCYDSKSVLMSYASDSVNRACNNLIPEDSPKGYLQYLFFHQMGEQFALYWHSYYGEKAVICSEKDIKHYLNRYKEGDSFSYNEDEIRDLLHVDLTPKIKLDSSRCTITWYEIYTHAGIFKRTYTIERKYPFRIKNVDKEEITTITADFVY